MPRMLQAGTSAPDFELPDSTGKRIRLSDFRGKKPVVLYFYPKDETAGCTAEACAFRDSYAEFTSAGAEVIGVSVDSVESHRSFAAHHRLPFLLLSDASNEVRQAYGVKATWGLIAGRVTFVIDRQGIIALVFESQIRAKEHVARALALIRQMGPTAGSGASPPAP